MNRISPEPQRVLVTRLRYLGDVVLTTPMLGELRRAFPSASIEYLTLEEHAPALEEHPHLDAVHALREGAGWRETLSMVRRLRRPRVDWWFDCFGNPRSALLAALARPRHSVGPDRGLRSRVFEHRRGAPDTSASAIVHHLDKLAPLMGTLEASATVLRVPAAEAQERCAKLGLKEGQAPLLLHPGSKWPSKAWPLEKWVSLARLLAAEELGPLRIVAPPTEAALASALEAGSGGAARALPALALRDLLALLAGSSAYVGNDGGILHCAAALGVPTVGIFGPTPVEIWFPHDQWPGSKVLSEQVPCRPCHRHHCDHLSCLRHLPPFRVRDALLEVMAHVGSSNS